MTGVLDRPRTGRQVRRPPDRPGRGGGRPTIDPRIAQRWVEARRQEGRRRLRILLGAGSVLGVAALGVGSLFTPIFAVNHVRVAVTGPATVSVARIQAEAGLAHHPQLISFSPAQAEARLDADPLLGKARVVKHWPATVTVSVTERTPLAQVQVSPAGPAGAATFAAVDVTGRVLAGSGPQTPGLPVLQITGPAPAPGRWLAGSAGPGAAFGSDAPPADMSAASDGPDVPVGTAAALAFLQALPSGLRSAVQTVTATRSGVSLVVVPPRAAAGTVSVNLGDGSQLGAKATALQTLLAGADLSGVTGFDLSVPNRPAATGPNPPSTRSGTPSG